MKRVVTALVLIPVSAYLLVWAPAWLFLLGACAVAFLCFHEYLGLVRAFGLNANQAIGYGIGAGILLGDVKYSPLLLLTGLLAMTLATFAKDLKQSLPQAGGMVLGLVYVFAAWRAGIELHAMHAYWLVFAVSINWAGDSMAYFVGRAIGKHKLAPAISPGKSREGAIASWAASCAYSVAFMHYLLPVVDLAHVLMFATAANIAGQVGDLAESALKRGAGVKDSGTSLPGHGGWLDRLDSSLFSMPVVYVLVRLTL